LVLPPRYEPKSPLGKGGGGEVWAVRDRITGKTVALKALGDGAHEREMLALVREAVMLSGVEGLGVPRVLRFGLLPGSQRAYLVRELVEGESLADALSRGMTPNDVWNAVAQAADQLTRLHRTLLLHGDVKPANIIVGPSAKAGELRATLVDLGLAATWREGGARPEGLTPKYAAPELFEGAPLTVRAEVFSLGATIGEALRVLGAKVPRDVRDALNALVSRATATDPSARHPSADELASALRRAAKLAEPPEARGIMAWPVVGLDAPAAKLTAQIAELRAGGGIVLTGPRGSGKSTLLRRIAWSLGVAGRKVAWVEAASVTSPREAIDIELMAYSDPSDVVLLIDDGERLGEEDLALLDQVRRRGARIVVSLSAPSRDAGIPTVDLPGPTFEIFVMTPLDAEHAGGVVRRMIPSLSDAVVAHIVARAEAWPGRLRAIVEGLERAPVVAPADVDRLLQEATGPLTSRAEINRLLDRGHYDEAAEVLARYAEDQSPPIAIARARLYANRGDAAGAMKELTRVEGEVRDSGSAELEASWLLNAARAHLRGGDYAEAERRALEAENRLGLSLPNATSSVTLSAGDAPPSLVTVPAGLRAIAAEAVVVRGLSQSFAARHDDARRTLEQAVRIARVVNEARIVSLALGSLAFALQRNEQLLEAKQAYEEALVAGEEAGDAGTVATTRLNLASIAHTQGDVAAGIRHLEAAVDMGKRSGRVATLRQALLNLANLELYLGRLARARVSLDTFDRQRAGLPPQQHAQLLALEAEFAARSGDIASAERLCAECAAAYETMGRGVDEAEARIQRVLYLTGAAGAPTDQRPAYDAAALSAELDLATARLGSATAHRAALGIARGRLAFAAGNEAEARVRYDEAHTLAEASGQKEWMWRALAARAELELSAGQSQRARRDREGALALLEEIAVPLPRDLREVFWNDPRRHALRAAGLLDFVSGATVHTPAAPVAGPDRLARVLEINRAIAGEHDLPRLLSKVTDHAIALLQAERGFVILRSGYAHPRDNSTSTTNRSPGDSASIRVGDLSIYASRSDGEDDPHARFSQSIAERVIRSGDAVVTASAREDARMADYVSVHQLLLQSIACVPIRVRSGQVIGALYLETRLRPAASFNDEVPTLHALADQVAIAIDTARLVSENERRAQELERANGELLAARDKLEELLGHRTAQLSQAKSDLKKTRAVLRSHFGYEGLVGTSEAMRRVYALIDRVKDNDVPVLIQGESGTGKEVVARAIHNAGPRAKKAFVGINCGAIPEHLLESELFGHVKGAFTGADRDRKGLFRDATEGTILLDEIGEMPQKMQAGLLRVLQEKVVRPVGGSREEPVDTRLIAATHRDLEAMVAAGTFREDLFYRLHVIQVRVPPLRERTDDIPILIDHFLGIFAARYSRERRSVSRAALKRLTSFSWPGNVRQLENVLLNAWVLSEKDELEPEDFELPTGPMMDRSSIRPAPSSSSQSTPSSQSNQSRPISSSQGSNRRLETSLDAHRAGEKERILQALNKCNWNRVKAAQLVGMPRRTFYRRLKDYGIQ
jgi:DNA-binding NtrC family response regulator/tetratricopeptide (TPR) repeat protein